MPAFALASLSIILVVAVLRFGGVIALEWYACLAVCATTALIYWISVPRGAMALKPPRLFVALSAGVLVMPSLQLLPLPLAVVRTVSPKRAEVHDALAAVVDAGNLVTLSIAPAATVRHLTTMAGYLILLLLIRELVWRYRDKVWLLAIPVVVAGIAEALLGLVQCLQLGIPEARGTYVSRNHYAGFLEMTVPFAVMGALAVAARRGRRRDISMPRVALAGACLTAGTLMLLAVVLSSSRMGFAATLAGLVTLGLAALASGFSGRVRAAGLLLLPVIAGAAFLALPTESLIDRFGMVTGPDHIDADVRSQVWRDTVRLIREYPLSGCGLGCYELGIHAYRTAAPLRALIFAHNDYLQILSETGFPGFVLLGAFAVCIAWRTVRYIQRPADPSSRYLAMACLGAFAAIALHSFTDFNLYIPANAFLLAWVVGISEGLQTKKEPRSHPAF